MKTKQILLTITLTLIGLMGCTAAANRDLDKMRVIELEAESKRLRSQLTRVQQSLQEFAQSRQGVLTQQIVSQPVTFDGGGNTLQEVQDRGVLQCGGNADLPGFGYLDPDSSEFIGFDIDICRAVAAAVFGPNGADNIDIIPLTSRLRFPSLQSGEIDLLVRNTTWTLSRDTTLGVDYAAVTFYDGQGMMVRKNSDIKKLSDLRGKTICAQSGSTSASNILDYYGNRDMKVELREFNDRIAARNEYEQEGCDGYTGDKSSLLAQQTLLKEPGTHKILTEDMSREPLGPVVRQGDEDWRDIVTWSVQCLINAETLDVKQKNVEEMLSSELLDIQRLLGVEGELGASLGLPNDFCYQIIHQVGNYADIYNRHLGADTQFNLPRGLNALYLDNGLHYPLPFK